MEAGTLRTVKEGYCALCYAKAKEKCSKCKRPYCSPACQEKDWKLGHKGDCGLADLPPLATVPSPPARMLRGSVDNPVHSELAWRRLVEATDMGPPPGVPRGLRNLGNSCYMNAVLQGLYHAAPLLLAACREHRGTNGVAGGSAANGGAQGAAVRAAPTHHCGAPEGCFRCDLEVMARGCLEPRPPWEETPEPQLRPGDRVALQGLAAKEWNGQEGIIEGALPDDPADDDARVGIRLLATAKMLSVRPRNLVFCCRAPEAPGIVVRWLPKIGEFNFGTQEDAHEFLRSLLRLIEDEELRGHAEALRRRGGGGGGGEAAESIAPAVVEPNADLTATPSRLFGGLVVSQCTCTNRDCAASSFSFEAFMDLSLDITEATDSVEDALRLFTAPERLDKKNGWRCETCLQTVRARKQIMIFAAPQLLVLQLKRFRYGGPRNKVTRTVTFEAMLNLRPFLWRHSAGEAEAGKPLLYELRAIVVHVDKAGFSQFGHYVTFARRRAQEGPTGAAAAKWYLLDDSQVYECTEAEVLQQQAYLLIYARASGGPEAPTQPGGGGASGSTGRKAASAGSDVAAEAALGLPGRCHGRNGAVCSFFACCEGLCTRCYQEEHGRPPPAEAMAPSAGAAGPVAAPASPPRARTAAAVGAPGVAGGTAAASATPEPKAKAAASSTGGKDSKKVGMNEKCPCGSGLKYKKCHGKSD